MGAATAVVAALASPASAATVRVQMGLPPAAQSHLDALASDVDAYFPHDVTIRVGDAVAFVPIRPRAPTQSQSLHTLDLPLRGRGALPFVVPTGLVATTRDAAGAQFWFRGFDLLHLNPRLRTRTFGKTRRYDGSRRVESGLPKALGSKPLTVRFPRAGNFTFHCDLHPGMTGTVHVVRKGARAPGPAGAAKAARAQLRAAKRTAARLAHAPVTPGVVNVGVAGPGGVERFAFGRASYTVQHGATVTFAVPPGSREIHTAATGPGDPLMRDTYLGRLARSFQASVPEAAAEYPSDPPTLGPVRLSPKLHGNGFWNAGVMDGSPATPPPSSQRVRFPYRGTYPFYCLIHPFMRTKIVVE